MGVPAGGEFYTIFALYVSKSRRLRYTVGALFPEKVAMMSLLQPESRYLTANGVRLHYFDWGNAGAPPMVCLHGFAMSATSFHGFARHFRDRYHIVALDKRGHGDSGSAPTDTYVYTYDVADVEAVVDALGFERFTLVGSSMGGRTGLLYAHRHPERVVRLVVNDVGAAPHPDGRSPAAGLVRPKEFTEPEDALPYLIQAMLPFNSLTEDERSEQARGLLRRREDGTWVWKLDQEIARQRRRKDGPPPPPLPDMWRVMEQIQCPALVVWGERSHFLDGPQARRMAEVLPRGELVELADVAHPPWLTEPAAIATLERFLSMVD